MWDILQNNWSGCLKNGNGMERKKKAKIVLDQKRPQKRNQMQNKSCRLKNTNFKTFFMKFEQQ